MKKVLIVSETSIITKSISEICQNKGFTVVCVESGLEAMALLFNQKFELLITSLFVEGLDGIHLIQSLKKGEGINGETPTILLTSGENIKELIHYNYGPDHVIQKDAETINVFQNVINSLDTDVDKKNLRILYIDDDRFIQKMIKLWLDKIYYIDLEICGSLADLKDVQDDFDLIVTDNILGDGELKDVLAYIDSSYLNKKPVLVYTGTISNLNIQEIKQNPNVIDILPKPFELKNFLNKIEQFR